MPTSRRIAPTCRCDSSCSCSYGIAHADRRAEPLLHRLDARDELRERARRAPVPLHARARDVRAVPVAASRPRRRSSDSARRSRRLPAVRDVVQRRRVLARARRCSCTASPGRPARRREVEQVQVELRRVAARGTPSRTASCPSAARRFASARQAISYGVFVVRSASSALTSSGGRRVAMPRRRARRSSPTNATRPPGRWCSRRPRRRAPSTTSKAARRRVALGRRRLLPEARRRGRTSVGLRPGRTTSAQSASASGSQCWKCGHGPERPVLIVEVGALDAASRSGSTTASQPVGLEDTREAAARARRRARR